MASDMADDVRLVAEWLGWKPCEFGDDLTSPCGRYGAECIDNWDCDAWDHFTARILDKLPNYHVEKHHDLHTVTIWSEAVPYGSGRVPTLAEAIIRATAAWLREEKANGE